VSTATAWSRALELTAPIVDNPGRLLSTVIAEHAGLNGEAPALTSDHERLTYRALTARANRYARWALDQNVAKGDVVCLVMNNRPEYMAIWLGITSVGGVVSLVNTNLTGASLAHCLNIAAPRHIIVSAELVDAVSAVLPDLVGAPTIWTHGAGGAPFQRIDCEIERFARGPLRDRDERREVTIHDRALLIFTSGTTGMPKAAAVSHGRLMQWSHWFAGMMDVQAHDRMYNCLPMYHSVGGVLATGAVLAGGGSVVIRDRFSASQFWSDVARWDCTLFQYIGELCRYLLHAGPHPHEHDHQIRMCCGNGLRADIWSAFKSRFRIPRILEFYAATESNVSLFNVEGKPGAVGRIPFFLGHRAGASIVKFDVDANEPVRTADGFCVRCAPGEAGEALGRISGDAAGFGTRFEGYTSSEASEQKILRNVFEPGDAWFRTGDLMRRDEQGYVYFVDRIGATFRWKGENVSTTEVADVICACPGITEAIVYGVAMCGADGRAGMATVVADEALDLDALRTHLVQHLPVYARPLFVRMRRDVDMTSTFKYATAEFARQGFDPLAISDPIYFNDAERGGFVRLDTTLYDRIQAGQVRL
jgi:fatty-acyl-CoA synthase